MRVLAGDTACYAELVQSHSRPLFNLAFRLTGDRHDAEELVQESFIRAYENLDRYNVKKPFFPWLYTIALNRIRDRLKTRKPVQGHDGDPASPAPGPSDQVGKQERDALLQQAVRELPEKLREPLALRFFQELSFGEIAEILEISVNSAKKRVYRGLEQLRSSVGSELFE